MYFLYLFTVIEIENLSQHGVMLPPNMIGLTDEQIEELKIRDEFEDICIPSGGYIMNRDPIGRRNGRGMPIFHCSISLHYSPKQFIVIICFHLFSLGIYTYFTYRELIRCVVISYCFSITVLSTCIIDFRQ